MFLLMVTVFVLLCIAIAAAPWFVPYRGETAANVEATNADVRSEQIKELDTRLAAGTLDNETYEELALEVDRRLLSEANPTGGVGLIERKQRITIIVVIAFILGVAAVAYQTYGANTEQRMYQRYMELSSAEAIDVPKALNLLQEIREFATPASIEKMEWLSMAAQGYMQLQHYRKSASTYDQMLELLPGDTQLLANAAQAHYLANDRQMAGTARQYLEQVFTIDPNHANALGFAGMAAFEQGRYVEAVGYWERAVAQLPLAEQESGVLAGALAEAKRRAGTAPAPAIKAPEPAAASNTIVVNLQLDPAIDVPQSKTVFVLAKAKTGPPMPLAVKRLRVSDLPTTITLSAADAMTPALTIEQFDELVVQARISQSGNAIASPGDIEATAQSVVLGDQGATADLIINRVID